MRFSKPTLAIAMILVMSVAAVLLAAIGGEIYVRLKSPYGYVTPEILRSRRQYRINVQTFVDVARNAGAVPVLVTEARLVSKKNEDADRKRINYEMVLLTHEALYHAFKEEDRILREISNEKQVHLTDSSAVLSGRSEFFLDAVHLTDRGSEALSSIVATSIASLLNNPARQQRFSGSTPIGTSDFTDFGPLDRSNSTRRS